MRNKISNTLWGLFFVAIGVGFAGNVLFGWDFHLFFDGWWAFLIIVPCFISMIQTGFGVGSTMGFIIGVLLFVSQRIDLNFNVWKLIVPGILIFIGIRLMFQNAFRRKPHISGAVPGSGQQTYTTGNHSDYSAVFSSNHIHADNEPFTGANLSAVFGAVVLDLRDVVIQNDVEITATAVFGGIDLYVPRGVRLKVNNVPIFGGVSDKSEHNADSGAPTIYLNSTCMFGGIDIK